MPYESINPSTDARVATYPTANPTEIDRKLTAAWNAQRTWARLSCSERSRPMLAAARLLRARTDAFAYLMALEMGKPLKDGAAEISKCAAACDYLAVHAEALLKPRMEASDASTSYVRFDPLGVVLAIMPWNFPFWQVFRFVAPHLMAGNGGVLKHAPCVPQCAIAIEQLMLDAGFPDGLFPNLMIENDTVKAVIEDPRIAAVTITGSERAGRTVAAIAGGALKPVVLELGGSDPFIVLADADLTLAATTAALARTMNTGQSCVCAKRFIVENVVYDDFVAKLTAIMRDIRIGDPLDPDTRIGPMARRDLRQGLHDQVTAAIAGGARCVLGGTIPDGAGCFYPPTILVDVDQNNPAANDELFGPVAVMLRARDAEHAMDLANATRFGLAASIWTSDLDRAQRFAARIEAGAVFINGQVKSDVRMPFGGIKASGFGRELGLEGIRAFVNTKTVWVR